MGDHTDEPHTHTITFRDDDGKAYSFDHDCPAKSYEDIARHFVESGATTVNDLAVDGRVLPFEQAFPMLGGLGLMPMLGKGYQTGENLMKLLISMGAPDASESEQEEVTA